MIVYMLINDCIYANDCIDLKKFLSSCSYYAGNIAGTNGYWLRHQKILKTVFTQLPTHFFHTLSFGDTWDKHLHRILGTQNSKKYLRRRALINNPHISAAYFYKKVGLFKKYILDPIYCYDWLIDRFEWQGRGVIHGHFSGGLKHAPDLCMLSSYVVKGFLAEKRLKNGHRIIEGDRVRLKEKYTVINVKIDNTDLDKSEYSIKNEFGHIKVVKFDDFQSIHSTNTFELGEKRIKSPHGIIEGDTVEIYGSKCSVIDIKLDDLDADKNEYSVENAIGEIQVVGHERIDLVERFDENELRDQVKEGEKAKKVIADFHDCYISCWNPLNEQERNSFRVPDPHPCSLTRKDVENEDKDHGVMVNTVQEHSCKTSYCQRKKKGTNEYSCRGRFPRRVQDHTTVEVVKRDDGGYKVVIVSKTNHPWTNQYQRFELCSFRTNMDRQLVIDFHALATYLAKYQAKAEKELGLLFWFYTK